MFANIRVTQANSGLVTVGKKKYWVYRYEGKLISVEKAVVLICYPENAFSDLAAIRAFMRTDKAIGSEIIIRYYTNRWSSRKRNCARQRTLPLTDPDEQFFRIRLFTRTLRTQAWRSEL
jgi:hypothetical protein